MTASIPTPEQALVIAAYPKPESCGAPHPDDPVVSCNLTPHGPDASHYGNGKSWR